DIESIYSRHAPEPDDYCEGIETEFDATASSAGSGGSITYYEWNFDDINSNQTDNPNVREGDPDAARRVSHTLHETGRYNVQLIVTSNHGCKSTPAFYDFDVGAIPVVQFDFTGVAVGDDFAFDINTSSGSSEVPSSPILSDGFETLTWSFGDGSSSAEISNNFNSPVHHQYGQPGHYTVMLKVTSTTGCVDSLLRDVVVVPRVQVTKETPYLAYFEDNVTSDDGRSFQTWPASSSWERGIATSTITSNSNV